MPGRGPYRRVVQNVTSTAAASCTKASRNALGDIGESRCESHWVGWSLHRFETSVAHAEPTTRHYSPDEKSAAVRMVRTLRAKLGTDHGTVKRVATQLGYGTESVRSWVRHADINEGHTAGVSTSGQRG